MARKSGLGKGGGLGALISTEKVLEINENITPQELDINLVEPNREQPRKNFDKEKLEELASSVKEHGMISPIIVVKEKDYYKIIAGERRWRAARLAGLTKVPVVVKDYDEIEAEQVALVENLQREDLNAVEEAEGYLRLIDKFGFTQEQLSQRMGKSRSAITNSMRILKLPAKILELVKNGELSEGHARAILGAEGEKAMIALAEKVVKEGLSVRQTEALAKGKIEKPVKKAVKIDRNIENAIEECVKHLEKRFSSKVKVKYSDKFKGKIEIPFKNMEEMNKLFELLDK